MTGEELGRVQDEFSRIHEELADLRRGDRELHAALLALHRTVARIGWAGMIVLIAAIFGAMAPAFF